MMPHFLIRLSGPVIPCLIAVAAPLFSQEGPTNDRAAKPASTGPRGSAPRARPGSAVTPQGSPNQQQLERLAKVTDKILDQIQLEENDLYMRLNYFEKPERLDPSSFASKDEIAQWQGILQQLKEKNDRVAGLYADVGKQLDVALKSSGANEEVSARFKQLVLDGFPWDQIERKKQLITDFIDEHGKLLIFYQKNWGSWIKGSDPRKPEFNSVSAANIYQRLRDQIVSTSDQIQKEYKVMSE
jgi:hypothetical protein